MADHDELRELVRDYAFKWDTALTRAGSAEGRLDAILALLARPTDAPDGIRAFPDAIRAILDEAGRD